MAKTKEEWKELARSFMNFEGTAEEFLQTVNITAEDIAASGGKEALKKIFAKCEVDTDWNELLGEFNKIEKPSFKDAYLFCRTRNIDIKAFLSELPKKAIAAILDSFDDMLVELEAFRKKVSIDIRGQFGRISLAKALMKDIEVQLEGYKKDYNKIFENIEKRISEEDNEEIRKRKERIFEEEKKLITKNAKATEETIERFYIPMDNSSFGERVFCLIMLTFSQNAGVIKHEIRNITSLYRYDFSNFNFEAIFRHPALQGIQDNPKYEKVMKVLKEYPQSEEYKNFLVEDFNAKHDRSIIF